MFPIIFAMLIPLTLGGTADEMIDGRLTLGVLDQDNSALSQMLISTLERRFDIVEISDDGISTALSEQTVPWVLAIRNGYGQNIINGIVPTLDAYSLTISDVSAFGNIMAQNTTRALMLLGSDDPIILADWETSSFVSVTVAGEVDMWGQILHFFGMYGFIAMFTASFIVKSLIDDKRNGMPERLGVLPVSARSVLMQGTLAAFVTMMISAMLMLVVLQMQMGEIPNIIHLFFLLSLYNLFCVGFVLAIVSNAKKLETVPLIVNMSATIFAMIGGLFWPLDFVPVLMQRAAWFSPGYWLGRGINNIHDIGFNGYVMPILFLLGFTVVVLLFGGFRKIQAVEE